MSFSHSKFVDFEIRLTTNGLFDLQSGDYHNDRVKNSMVKNERCIDCLGLQVPNVTVHRAVFAGCVLGPGR